jgi:TfoX/Sxy family transcriptional regulator of competence genes
MCAKWYIEEQTKELRQTLEKVILSWYKVTYKKMFGCPCYLANGKMFVGLVTKGIVITKLDESERKELKKIRETQPFNVGRKILKKWVRLNIDPMDLKSIMSFIEKSYEHALHEA